MKIGVVTPLFVKNDAQYEFMIGMTKSLKSKEHDLIFIPVENMFDPAQKMKGYVFSIAPKEMHPIAGRQPQSVSKAWNDGIRTAQQLGCEYVVVLNEDIILRHDAIDKLVAFAEECKKIDSSIVLWSMAQFNDFVEMEKLTDDQLQHNYHEHPNFSAFMVRFDFLDVMGNFDENFRPAYMEDCDMHARIALSNKKAVVYSGALFFHFGSRTIHTESEISQEVRFWSKRCSDYFLKKWGHPIVNEVDQMRQKYYKTPYNIPSVSLTSWNLEVV